MTEASPFPPARGAEPVLTLAEVLENPAPRQSRRWRSKSRSSLTITNALGDTGKTRSVLPQDSITDKLVSDFQESDAALQPAFLFHPGNIVDSFREAQYNPYTSASKPDDHSAASGRSRSTTGYSRSNS
jgi:hypothetical protein